MSSLSSDTHGCHFLILRICKVNLLWQYSSPLRHTVVKQSRSRPDAVPSLQDSFESAEARLDVMGMERGDIAKVIVR